jgi:hypothetical protein
MKGIFEKLKLRNLNLKIKTFLKKYRKILVITLGILGTGTLSFFLYKEIVKFQELLIMEKIRIESRELQIKAINEAVEKEIERLEKRKAVDIFFLRMMANWIVGRIEDSILDKIESFFKLDNNICFKVARFLYKITSSIKININFH